MNSNTQYRLSSNTDSRFAEIVEGKRIALIGPASYLSEIYMRERIETYDLIVRLNRDFPPNLKFYENVGAKTDIWYVVSKRLHQIQNNKLADLILRHNMKSIVISFPNPSRCGDMKKRLSKHLVFRDIHFQDYSTYHQVLNAKPATGNMAILDLLSYDIKELFIAGITFYRDGLYREGYANDSDQKRVKNSQEKRHKPEKQLEFMLKVFREDARVNVEETMQKIIGM